MARSLKRIALVVTYGTLLSKVGGLVRQLVIAAAFGVGAAYDAYNYAYVLPGFLLILLGGINGPFHSAMVSVLSRRPREDGAHILATLNTMVSALLLLVTIVLVLAADPLITLVGPGLSPELHRIAAVQLQVMAPMALLAGLIGLGFGSLNAADEFWIPAISPLMSSLALIVGIGLLWWQAGSAISTPALALWGGVVLALSTLVGSFLQWLLQLPASDEAGAGSVASCLGLAASRCSGGLAGDGPGHSVVGNAADQCVHRFVFRLGVAWSGGWAWLRQFAGSDAAGVDFQRVVGAAVANLFPSHGSARSPRADRSHPSGLDVVDGFDASPWCLIPGPRHSHRGVGVRTGCLQSRSGGARDGLVDGLWTWHAGLSRQRCIGARVLRPWATAQHRFAFRSSALDSMSCSTGPWWVVQRLGGLNFPSISVQRVWCWPPS